MPRFEYVEACAPGLDEALEAHGFALESRAQLMVCPRGKERAAKAVSGLDVATLDAATPLGEFAAFLDVQRRAFGFPSGRLPSDEEALNLRETLGDGFAFLGRIAGEPVATAMIQPAHDGLDGARGRFDARGVSPARDRRLPFVGGRPGGVRTRRLTRVPLRGRRESRPRLRGRGLLLRRPLALLPAPREPRTTMSFRRNLT